ncbi:MAG: sensor domain-containing diguanylate cyclase [Lachnospiraceae bacterium]|nr:sensor domain-containing diguanylate cyclase [Lachnospiraceae bacterium]
MISESMDLMNRIPGAFFVFDRHTYKFVFVSDGLLNLFGLSEKAFLEKYYNSFEMFMYKEDRKRVKELLEGQFDFEDYCEANFRVKSILDDEKFMIFQGRLVVENDGSENVYGLLFDVTEMVVSQQEINRMNQELYNKTAEEHNRHLQISNRARMDSLTGILNKATVTDTIIDYLKESEPDQIHALLMIDCDNFKKVNDNFGHAVGDEVIKYFASVLKRTFRDSDVKGRFGGDEFMVFMKNTTKEATILRATQLNEAIKKPYLKDGKEIKISCSIGVAYYPKDGNSFENLFEAADDALYKAKSAGKDRFYVYTKD